MTEELVRDCLVVGIRDSALSEMLQMDATLTLDAAKKAVRQKEAVHEQQQTLNAGGRTNTEVDSINSHQRRQRPHGQR